MIRINLLSTREIQAEIGRRQDLAIAAVAVGAALLLGLVVFLYQFYRSMTLQRDVASVRAEIAAIEGKAREVAELQKGIAELKSKVAVIDSLSKKKVGPVRVMESLSTAAPPRLWVLEFKENSGNLTMTGLAIDNQTIADFLKALQATAYFKDVELVETSQSQQDKLALKKFVLRSRLVYQPTPPQEVQAKAAADKTAAPDGSKKP
ncbi:MAG TPA: PilN domain-containing protein [Candidatus Binatia bacterium]